MYECTIARFIVHYCAFGGNRLSVYSFLFPGSATLESNGPFLVLENFLEDLNATYGSGVLTCDYEGQEFKAFLKWLMKNYFQ